MLLGSVHKAKKNEKEIRKLLIVIFIIAIIIMKNSIKIVISVVSRVVRKNTARCACPAIPHHHR
jgi:hypothetical protein